MHCLNHPPAVLSRCAPDFSPAARKFALPGLLCQSPRGRRLGAGPCQPARRTHRLQRWARTPIRVAAADRGPRGPRRGVAGRLGRGRHGGVVRPGCRARGSLDRLPGRGHPGAPRNARGAGGRADRGGERGACRCGVVVVGGAVGGHRAGAVAPGGAPPVARGAGGGGVSRRARRGRGAVRADGPDDRGARRRPPRGDDRDRRGLHHPDSIRPAGARVRDRRRASASRWRVQQTAGRMPGRARRLPCGGGGGGGPGGGAGIGVGAPSRGHAGGAPPSADARRAGIGADPRRGHGVERPRLPEIRGVPRRGASLPSRRLRVELRGGRPPGGERDASRRVGRASHGGGVGRGGAGDGATRDPPSARKVGGRRLPARGGPEARVLDDRAAGGLRSERIP